MNKKIKLNNLSIARLDNSEPFIIQKNEELSITFTSDYVIDNCIIYLKNNNKSQSFSMAFPFVVPDEFIKAGKLEIAVSLLSESKILKKWTISPILIKDIDGDITAVDFLTNLEQRVNALEDKNKIIL